MVSNKRVTDMGKPVPRYGIETGTWTERGFLFVLMNVSRMRNLANRDVFAILGR